MSVCVCVCVCVLRFHHISITRVCISTLILMYFIVIGCESI